MFSNTIIHRTLVGEFQHEKYHTHFSMVFGENLEADIHNTALILYDCAKPGVSIKEKADDPLLEEIRQGLREVVNQS